MKKQFLAICSIALISVSAVFGQSYSPMSIQLKGGINTLRGAYAVDAWDRDYNPEFGGAIEYSMSPIIGVGVEYLFQNNDHTGFTSQVNQATVFTSLNLSNLALKYRTGFWEKFNTYLNVGAGLGFGEYDHDVLGSDDFMNLAASFGLNMEYNISRIIAIGIEGQYRWNSNGEYNPVGMQMMKDFYTVNANIRFKIPSKGRTHVRNVSMTEYEGMYAGVQQLVAEAEPVEEVVAEPTNEVSAVSADTVAPVVVNKPVPAAVVPAVAVETEMSVPTESEADFPTEDIDTNISMRTEAYVNTSLKRYSVVIGSFMNKANADALVMKLKSQGYDASVIQNEQGMNRVVIFTSNGVAATVSQARAIRASYPDAWVLILK